MTRVGLVQPLLPDGNHIPALGLLYIAAVLERSGFEVRLYDESVTPDYLEALVAFNPTIVEYTVVTAAANRVVAAAGALKRRLPDAKIVAGGPHVCALPEEVARHPAIDYCIVEEGEYAMLDLCRRLAEGRSPHELPNVVCRHDGAVVANRPRPLLDSAGLDGLPYPAFHLLDLESVFKSTTHGLYSRGRRILPLMSSRGCPHTCTYCCRVMGRRIRARSAENVLAEIGFLVDRYHIDGVYFEDDNFTVNRARALEILEGIARRFPGLHIKFANGLRADRVDEELLRAIKKAGGYWVGFGIESGSPRTLQRMKKTLDLTKARKNVECARNLGFLVGSNFIIGYPGDTWRDVLESIRFFERLGLDSLAIVNLVPFPGTELRALCEREGYLTDEAANYDNYYFGVFNIHPLIATPGFSTAELRLAVWYAYARFYLAGSVRSPRRLKAVVNRLVSSALAKRMPDGQGGVRLDSQGEPKEEVMTSDPSRTDETQGQEARVKHANRVFFDLVSENYEDADRRRGPALAAYLGKQIDRIRVLTQGERLLDLGTGSGFAASVARSRFPVVVGADISQNILVQAARRHGDCSFVRCDVDVLPFASDSFDGVVAIAVLHHLFQFDKLLKEVHRVLKPGGVLYTDHDIEKRFCQVFRLPLALFRLLRNEERAYRRVCPELTRELYELSEFQRNGVDVEALRASMLGAGFRDVQIFYHWHGLSGFFDSAARFLSPEGRGVRGFAPSFSIWARK